MNESVRSDRRFWWVNQNQTFEQEFAGGYLWSPKRKANGDRNPFYEFMREVSPGDIVFSFRNTRIPAVGAATDHCFECPKPLDFGAAGRNWSRIGWKVPIHWTRLSHPIRPSEHMAELGSLLPNRYAPLRADGRGLQSVYLAEVPSDMAFALARLIGPPADALVRDVSVRDVPERAGRARAELAEWEDHLESEILATPALSETERTAVVRARRGQGTFRDNVMRVEHRCRLTRVERAEHLVASHCKPWRDCTSVRERLDGENGLLLTPSVDHLFDRGFISFENGGRLIVSPSADRRSLQKMGIDTARTVEVGAFSDGQKRYLEFHRDQVLLASENKPR